MILKLLLFLPFIIAGKTANDSPLSAFSKKWSEQKYAAANTVSGVSYMSDDEKEVIYILNLMKMDPQLFLNTVVMNYPVHSGDPSLKNNPYFQSLIKDLKNTAPMPVLKPDQKIYESALCHALSSGKTGYVGHERLNTACKAATAYYGECISYGHDSPLDIVMALLIDKNIPGTGHRKIFLTDYKTAGVSIKPHTKYRNNAVIDFGY